MTKDTPLGKRGDGDMSEDGWRPIETAPRDGTYILIGWFEFEGQNSMEVAFWHGTLGAWCQTSKAFTSDPNWQPTHWMPLPSPPSALFGTPIASDVTGHTVAMAPGSHSIIIGEDHDD